MIQIMPPLGFPLCLEEVFHLAPFPGGLTFPWPASDAQRLRDGRYTELEVELALDCEAGRWLTLMGELMA